MAKIRCSNCEKGIKRLNKNDINYVPEDRCVATGEDITGKVYTQERKSCEEFMPKLEYMPQYKSYYNYFIELIDKIKIRIG